MPVTKQTYTVAPTWTAVQLADSFRSAFIDAGIMTDWFDSFASAGIENRLLRIVYDATKLDGFIIFWFMFTTGGVFLHSLADFDQANNIPRGTQYLDFYSTVTNVTTNHRSLMSLANTTSFTITRYTSQINTSASVFLLRNGGTTRLPFVIPTPGLGPQSFIDQNRYHFNLFLAINSEVSANVSAITTQHVGGHLRKTFMGSMAFRGITAASSYTTAVLQNRFYVWGNANTTSNNWSLETTPGVLLPTGSPNTNTQLTTDHVPVYTSPSLSAYMQSLPADFGLIPFYTANTPIAGDKIIITAGIEEWEIIQYSNNTGTGAAQLYFAARVTG